MSKAKQEMTQMSMPRPCVVLMHIVSQSERHGASSSFNTVTDDNLNAC